ncbi:MAG: hypothetical protein AB3N24_15605 [Leisingera sp.]
MFKSIFLAAALFSLATPSSANSISTVESLWKCVDQKVSEQYWTGVDLVPARIIELSDPYVFVYGDLGWHLTWGVLFDATPGTPLAYETYGAKGDITGAFGRMETPEILSDAIAGCGAEWIGVWPGDWPDEGKQESKPPRKAAKPIVDLPIEDLLPPRQ